jgi:hypothetical protein
MNEFEKTWDESFKNYAKDIAKIYKKHPEQITCCMGFDSVVGCLNETYQSFVKQGELTPIEEIEASEKLRLWELSKQYSDNRAHRELICRSLYLLNELTKETETTLKG